MAYFPKTYDYHKFSDQNYNKRIMSHLPLYIPEHLLWALLQRIPSLWDARILQLVPSIDKRVLSSELDKVHT